MKTIILIFLLFPLTIVETYGQWYYKKYGVTDVNFLSKAQMETSFEETKNNLLASGVVAAAGGLLIWAGRSTLRNGLDEDASFIEDLLGAEFIGRTCIFMGAGMVAGGAVAGLVFLGRHERIKGAIKYNYGPPASLIISPSVITNRITQSETLGLTMVVSF